MKLYVPFAAALTLLVLGTAFLAGCEKGTKGAPGGEVEIAQKVCPVMGGRINKKVYVDHEGRRVYFCCPGCINAFKKDPERYLEKLDAQLSGEA